MGEGRRLMAPPLTHALPRQMTSGDALFADSSPHSPRSRFSSSVTGYVFPS